MALPAEERASQRGRVRVQATIPENVDPDAQPQASSSSSVTSEPMTYKSVSINTPGEFDINSAYVRALVYSEAQHPLAAILALTDMIEVSTATTVTGLMRDLTDAKDKLMATQSSLGVRAGCQLFERFVRDSGAGQDFNAHKALLVHQGREFCHRDAPECRRRIAESTIQFLSDDCVILTHSYSRTVMQALLKAHAQNKRIKVYVTEARPQGLGMKTHQQLTQAGIPCTVILDSAVAYILERVDIVLVGAEAVVESGGLVSSIGTSQLAYLAKAMGKPFFALAESFKFLRYYPLNQADIPVPKWRGKQLPLEFDDLEDEEIEELETTLPIGMTILPHTTAAGPSGPGRPGRLTRMNTTQPATPRRISLADSYIVKGGTEGMDDYKWEMTEEMERKNPTADITGPELIDLVITDLAGAIPPTSVSQYLVAIYAA